MITLKPTSFTQIYVSDVGYLVIFQENSANACEETVMLSPDQSKFLFDFINEHFEDQRKKWSESIHVKDEEDT